MPLKLSQEHAENVLFASSPGAAPFSSSFCLVTWSTLVNDILIEQHWGQKWRRSNPSVNRRETGSACLIVRHRSATAPQLLALLTACSGGHFPFEILVRMKTKQKQQNKCCADEVELPLK